MKYNHKEDGYMVTIHYNGNAPIAQYEQSKSLSGRWVCENDEKITVHEILQVCNDSYDRKRHPYNSRLGIKIINDACGSAGLLYDMLKRERYYPNIWRVTFYFSCDWNQISFADDYGGKFTKDFLHNDSVTTGKYESSEAGGVEIRYKLGNKNYRLDKHVEEMITNKYNEVEKKLLLDYEDD